ncbi:MAG: DUF4404 family protein [Victivallaceae bacterium]|nr:DUF4404 family protein [Victivallaceae bacterium]
MSLKKIEAIEKEIRETSQLDARIKEDLLDLMCSLKTELSDLNKIRPDTAQDIADKTQVSTKQLLASGGEPAEFRENIAGLRGTVEEFEASHPKLVGIINHLCMMLSDLGI